MLRPELRLGKVLDEELLGQKIEVSCRQDQRGSSTILEALYVCFVRNSQMASRARRRASGPNEISNHVTSRRRVQVGRIGPKVRFDLHLGIGELSGSRSELGRLHAEHSTDNLGISTSRMQSISRPFDRCIAWRH